MIREKEATKKGETGQLRKERAIRERRGNQRQKGQVTKNGDLGKAEQSSNKVQVTQVAGLTLQERTIKK